MATNNAVAVAQLPNLDEFLRRPTRKEWEREIELGWPGPDGSSMSTDKIMRVRIGVTSPSYRHVDLAANRHDWYYRRARRFQAEHGESVPESYRAGADAIYRALCIAECYAVLVCWPRGPHPLCWTLPLVLVSLVYPLALVRCHCRYFALRFAARFAWTAKAKTRNATWAEA